MSHKTLFSITAAVIALLFSVAVCDAARADDNVYRRDVSVLDEFDQQLEVRPIQLVSHRRYYVHRGYPRYRHYRLFGHYRPYYGYYRPHYGYGWHVYRSPYRYYRYGYPHGGYGYAPSYGFSYHGPHAGFYFGYSR